MRMLRTPTRLRPKQHKQSSLYLMLTNGVAELLWEQSDRRHGVHVHASNYSWDGMGYHTKGVWEGCYQ
jgi:hypothetical protein